MTTCNGTVGSRPWWMGVDQYDGPCGCVLPANHDGAHQCAHTINQGAPR